MERAEEIIAEVYRQILDMRSQGVTPRKILMPSVFWNQIGEYRQSLGLIDGPVSDYLSGNDLFGLEIWYHDTLEIRVE